MMTGLGQAAPWLVSMEQSLFLKGRCSGMRCVWLLWDDSGCVPGVRVPAELVLRGICFWLHYAFATGWLLLFKLSMGPESD